MKKTKGMQKRAGVLQDSIVLQAAEAKARSQRIAADGQQPEHQEDDEYIPTAVSLRKSYWRLLRQVADARADRGQPGRRSSSRVIAELIDKHRAELEAEITA